MLLLLLLLWCGGGCGHVCDALMLLHAFLLALLHDSQHVSNACMSAHSNACMLSTQHGSLPPPQYVTEGRACMLCSVPALFLPPHPPLQSADPDASDDGCPAKQPGSSSRKARRISSSAGGAAAGGLAAFGGGISSSMRAAHKVGGVYACACVCACMCVIGVLQYRVAVGRLIDGSEGGREVPGRV
jgi:hypothetical protein